MAYGDTERGPRVAPGKPRSKPMSILSIILWVCLGIGLIIGCVALILEEDLREKFHDLSDHLEKVDDVFQVHRFCFAAEGEAEFEVAPAPPPPGVPNSDVNDENALVNGYLEVNDITNTLKWFFRFTFSEECGIIAWHIHGPSGGTDGSNGPVFQRAPTLSLAPAGFNVSSGILEGSLSISGSDIRKLLNKPANFYVNFPTTCHGGGAARAQFTSICPNPDFEISVPHNDDDDDGSSHHEEENGHSHHGKQEKRKVNEEND